MRQSRRHVKPPRSPLAALDLNLLVALEALLAERSVTRAARRLRLTQPATSNALARLRVALGDPLLLRGRTEMVPTPRALALAGPLSEALRGLERALEARGEFDPTSAHRMVTIATSDYVTFVLLAPLAEKLARQAPGIVLRVVPPQADLSANQLERGSVDLTIGFFKEPPKQLRRLPLFTDHLVTVARRDRTPPIRNLAEVTAARHVQIAPHGETMGMLDVALERKGLARPVALLAPNFLVALTVIRGDLVCVVPERFARALSEIVTLDIIEAPLGVPEVTIAAYWHERTHASPLHTWLRGQLATIAAGVSPAGRAAPASRRRRRSSTRGRT